MLARSPSYSFTVATCHAQTFVTSVVTSVVTTPSRNRISQHTCFGKVKASVHDDPPQEIDTELYLVAMPRTKLARLLGEECVLQYFVVGS